MGFGWICSDKLFDFCIALIIIQEYCRSEKIMYADRGHFCNVSPRSWPTWDGPGFDGSNFSTYADKFNINLHLPNAQKIEIFGNINVGEYNMQIFNISSAEEGFYRCTEFINQGTLPITTVYTLKIREAPWNITVNDSYNEVLQGEENRLMVLCCSVNNSSNASMKWYNGSLLLGIGGPGLFSIKVVPKRYDHNKTYTCAVSSSTLRPGSNKSIVLDIQYKPIVTLHKGQVIKVQEGQNITLSCIVDSHPTAKQIYFEKDGFILDVSNSTHSLNLNNISREQTGTYGCKADNGIGIGYTNVIVIVEYTTYNPECHVNMFIQVSITLISGLFIGSVFSSLLFISYIRHSRRHAEMQQVPTGEPYYEIGSLTSHGLNTRTLSASTERDIPQQTISNDNEASSETDGSNDDSNRSSQGQQGYSYENAYQPLDLNATEIHVYDKTRVLSAVNLPNYLNTQIFNTDV